jgi:hypothetical protein
MGFFLPSTPLMGSAGIDMGGGGGDMSGVMDSTIDTGTDTGADEGAVDDATGTTDDTTTDEAAPVEDTAATGEPFKGRAIENGKINPAAKAVLDEIKAKSPALEKQIRNALIRQDVFAREFGSVQDVKAKIAGYEATINELGGADGVAKTKEDLAYFNDIDQQFTAGDPRFIEALVASPEGKASFLKVAPAMIEKYASMHPEGFDSYLAGKMKAQFDQSGLGTTLREMKYFIDRIPDSPEKNEVLDRWSQTVAGTFNPVVEKAGKQVAAPKIEGVQDAPARDDGRETALTQREQSVKNQEYGLTWKSELTGVVGPALTKLRTERGFNSTTEAAIKELFASRFDKVVAAKGQNAAKFFKAGDKAGYQNAIRALFREEAPKTLASVVDHFAPAKAGKKPAAAAPGVRQSENGVPVKAPIAEAGWKNLTVKPGIAEIDFDRTRNLGPNAYSNGQAVLKDGRKVKFPR